MGFSMSWPAAQAFERTKADLGKAWGEAAAEVGVEIAADMVARAKEAGASGALLNAIDVYQDGGEIVVGVPARAGAAAGEAHDLEYGTAVGAPSGWCRTAVLTKQKHLDEQFTKALNRRLFGAPRG